LPPSQATIELAAVGFVPIERSSSNAHAPPPTLPKAVSGRRLRIASLDRSHRFLYIGGVLSKTIQTRAHTTKDGRLNLSVDVDIADVDVAVVMTVTPLPAGSHVDENGWPAGFFDRVAGSLPDLRRGPQGKFEERLPLE